jgi:2-polyprenyl-3-methyl-5-hydroxy-6-metoxy-1,4-benzoquinol methylase
MQKRHLNKEQYFQEQSHTTGKYVIPYIEGSTQLGSVSSVLEVGCGEGGNLKPFLDRGLKVTGIELLREKIDIASTFFENHPQRGNLKLIAKDIYKIDECKNFKFDLILLRDTIEHIPNQDKLLGYLKNFLNPGGKIFFAFPPWRMPFGGHQHACKNKILSMLPYTHLLPKPIFKILLQLFRESDETIKKLMFIYDTRISIQKFLELIGKNDYKIDKITYFLINPNYEVKFKLKPVKLPFFLNIPYLRDFYTTTLYAIVSSSK